MWNIICLPAKVAWVRPVTSLLIETSGSRFAKRNDEAAGKVGTANFVIENFTIQISGSSPAKIVLVRPL